MLKNPTVPPPWGGKELTGKVKLGVRKWESKVRVRRKG